MKQISCFISPHGYGHATRCVAVLESLLHFIPDLRIQLLTTVPESLFHQTLDSFEYHPVAVDLGMVQNSALNIDPQSTLEGLDQFYPFQENLIHHISNICSGSSIILCDIAPLGICVGKFTGIPSVLLGNFTWDWIYTNLFPGHSGIRKHIEYLSDIFGNADYRILTEPKCNPVPHDLACGPVFRKQRKTGDEAKELLGYSGERLVVVTMGGFSQQMPDPNELAKLSEFKFLFTGQPHDKNIGKNIRLLSRNTELYHPDIIGAADVVVCKAGYSTVAECCQTGARVISVGASKHAESYILQQFLEEQLAAINISPSAYLDGRWSQDLYCLMNRPKPQAAPQNGADTAAAFLHRKILGD